MIVAKRCCRVTTAGVCMCVCGRSGRRVWLPGRRHGLGPLSHRPGAGLRVPGHLLLLGADLGHLPHRAPLQHSRAAPVQGSLRLGGVATQRAPPPQRPQQRLRGAGQRARHPRRPRAHHGPQAKVFLRPGGGQLCDLQCQTAKQGGRNWTNWALGGSNSENAPLKREHTVFLLMAHPRAVRHPPLFFFFCFKHQWVPWREQMYIAICL